MLLETYVGREYMFIITESLTNLNVVRIQCKEIYVDPQYSYLLILIR
jgi:hypothetical protein